MNDILTKQFNPQLFIEEFHEDSQKFIQEYSCPLCEGILFEAVIDRCGHSFCKACVETLSKNEYKCPFSKLEIYTKDILPNIVVNSVIEKQIVYCKNKKNDCPWIGKLGDRKNHLYYDCEKEFLLCEFIGCEQKIPRELMNAHIAECPFRLVKCHHCGESFNFNQMENHYKICPGFPFECPNGCGLKIKQSEVSIHLEVFCDNSIADCPFKLVGCTFSDVRKELKKHLNDYLEQHLKLINNKIQSLQDQITKQKDDIHYLKKENKNLKGEIDENKNMIIKSNNDLVSSINILSRNMDNLKLYSPIPASTFVPNLFNFEFTNYTPSMKDIFDINAETYAITKISENHGWYGISSEPIILTKEKVIVNMKIKKSVNSTIMFGITFSNQKCPLTDGFYQQTNPNDSSYMYYCYNSAVYSKGRSHNYGTGSCVENDVITLIIDPIEGKIVFRRNGVQCSDPIDVDFFQQEVVEMKGSLRIALDFSEYLDEVMFLY